MLFDIYYYDYDYVEDDQVNGGNCCGSVGMCGDIELMMFVLMGGCSF